MEVVLIKYRSRYENLEETIGIAVNQEAAVKYMEDLATRYPLAYGSEYGTAYYEAFDLIEE
jgi:hypothetical protein